jgi:hypothetical protein
MVFWITVLINPFLETDELVVCVETHCPPFLVTAFFALGFFATDVVVVLLDFFFFLVEVVFLAGKTFSSLHTKTTVLFLFGGIFL